MENHDFMPFYTAVLPHDPWRDAAAALVPFWLCYQVGRDGKLYRCAPQKEIHGGILCASDGSMERCGNPERFCQQVIRECHATEAKGFCANWSHPPTPSTQKLISTLENALSEEGLSFFVTPPYADCCENAFVLLSTAVSQHPLTHRLHSACERYGNHHIILTFEHSAADYLLPVPSQGGRYLQKSQLEMIKSRHSPAVYWNDDFMLHYFTYEQQGQTHLTLFDDEETFFRKKTLAEEWGLAGFLAVYREISHYLASQEVL